MDIEQEARDLSDILAVPEDFYIHYQAILKALKDVTAERNAVQQELDDYKRKVSDKIKRLFIPPAELREFILPAPINPHVEAMRAVFKARGISDPNDGILADGVLADAAALYESVLAEHGIVIGEK